METAAVVFNPFDPVWKADPYPFYKRLREEAPIGQVPGIGIWYVARFADCEALLHDPRLGSDTRKSDFYRRLADSQAVRMPDEVTRERSFLFLDPPDHTRLRGLVAGTFTPRVVQRLRPRIELLADELLDAALERGHFDVVADLAYPLPFTIISELLGIPVQDQELFRGWSRDMAGSNDPMMAPPPEVLQRQARAMDETDRYLRGIIAERRQKPADDLITALLQAEREGDKLTEEEMLRTIVLLVAAGHESTASLIGNSVLALSRHPDQWDRLRAEPGLARNAVEETLRWDAPVQLTQRVALQDIGIGEQTLSRGSPVLILIAAANRDEAANPDGEGYDICRQNIRHLAFGLGPHFCLGAPLARSEVAIALSKMAARLRSLDVEVSEVRRRQDLVMRGLESLPLRI